MSSLSLEKKSEYRKKPEVGIVHRGYGRMECVEAINGSLHLKNCNYQPFCTSAMLNPEPKISRDGLFAKQPTGWKLPSWLEQYEWKFATVLSKGDLITNIIFGVFEKQLQLAPGTLTACHRPTDASHSFLRILRYPGLKDGQSLGKPRFAAHRDYASIAMLFTWMCGLQIPEENPTMIAPGVESEDNWRWVEPVYGHAIVSLGDAMPIFTNNKLSLGKHRVVTAYGEQAQVDRTSVLISTRPAHETAMKAFESPTIPPTTADRKNDKIMIAKEWGDHRFKGFIQQDDDCFKAFLQKDRTP